MSDSFSSDDDEQRARWRASNAKQVADDYGTLNAQSLEPGKSHLARSPFLSKDDWQAKRMMDLIEQLWHERARGIDGMDVDAMFVLATELEELARKTK